MVNAFLKGAMGHIASEQAEENLAATRRKEKGIAALADEFGDTALAPSERATVHATERGDTTLADRQTQQKRTNKRQDKTDIEADAAATLERKTTAGRRAVNAVEQGMKNNVPMPEILKTVSTALTNLGVPEEEQLQLAQALEEDPNNIHALKALFAKEGKTGVRRATQRYTITNADGSTTLRQGYNDGTSEIIPGQDTKIVQAGERIENAEVKTADSRRAKADKLNLDERKNVGKEIVANRKATKFVATQLRAAKTVVRDVDNMFKLTDKIDNFQTTEPGQTLQEAVERAVSAGVLGTEEADVAAFLNSIKSNIGIDTLLGIKASGAGLGQVPQSQLETLQSVLGNLDIRRSPELLLNDLKDIKTMYEEIIAGANASIKGDKERFDQLIERRDTLEETQFGSEDEEPLSDEEDARLNETYDLGD